MFITKKLNFGIQLLCDAKMDENIIIKQYSIKLQIAL